MQTAWDAVLVETTAATFTTAATLVAMGGGICLVAATRGKHRRQGTHISWKRQYQNITVSIDRILYHKRSGIIDKRGLESLMYAMVVSSLYAWYSILVKVLNARKIFHSMKVIKSLKRALGTNFISMHRVWYVGAETDLVRRQWACALAWNFCSDRVTWGCGQRSSEIVAH